MKIAFATCSAMPDGDVDYQPAAEAPGATFEVWNDPQVDWVAYDRVAEGASERFVAAVRAS